MDTSVTGAVTASRREWNLAKAREAHTTFVLPLSAVCVPTPNPRDFR